MNERILKEITVEVTQQCPNKCIFCSSESSIKCSTFIPYEKLKEISLFAKSKGATEINISGGEPRYHDHIEMYLDYNNMLGLKSNFYTSGNCNIESLLNALRFYNITNVKFIFDYPSYRTDEYFALTGRDSLSTVNENIKKCIDRKFDVEVHFVPTEINMRSVYNTCLWLKRMGVKQVNLLKLVIQGRAKEFKEVLEVKNYRILKEEVEDIKKNLCDDTFKLRCGIPFNDIAKQHLKCTAITNKLVIKYDGNILPCEAFKEDKDLFVLGNIYKDSLEDVWENTNSYSNNGECLCNSKSRRYLDRLTELSQENGLYDA